MQRTSRSSFFFSLLPMKGGVTTLSRMSGALALAAALTLLSLLTACDADGPTPRDPAETPLTVKRQVIDRSRRLTLDAQWRVGDAADPNPFDQDSPAEYDHFGPDGTFLGATSGTIPLWFDGTTMISLERDELGVESVVQYSVGGG